MTVIDAAERVLGRVEVGDCWTVTKRLTADGYGLADVKRDGRWTTTTAHRAVYEALVGPVDDDLDHLCRNRACVNPDHLEPVTHSENMLRALAATDPYCRNGHERRLHTFINRAGHKRCRVCRNEAVARHHERKAQSVG